MVRGIESMSLIFRWENPAMYPDRAALTSDCEYDFERGDIALVYKTCFMAYTPLGGYIGQ